MALCLFIACSVCFA